MSLSSGKFLAKTLDGDMPVRVFHPQGEGPWPVVWYLMDAIGIRPELLEVASKLAAQGYFVAVPNLYYRHGDVCDIDLQSENGRARMMELYGSVSHAGVSADVGVGMEALANVPEADSSRPAAVVGYCMSGAFAVSIANAYPEQVAVVASIHPGHLVTGQPDSPHRNLQQIKAELYFAIADEDPYATEAEMAELVRELEKAGISYRLEFYRGAHHGFSFPSLPSYDAAASERHWQTVVELLNKTFA